jgi:hypothetical protein
MGHFLLSEVKMPGKYSLFFALSEAQSQGTSDNGDYPQCKVWLSTTPLA